MPNWARWARRPLGMALLGLCSFSQKPFLSAAAGAGASLPLEELCRLHLRFGGDASVWENNPMPQRANMLLKDGPFTPFNEEQFSFLGGDAFEYLKRWKAEGKTFDVVYAGCSFDPNTEQLKLFLGQMKPDGAAVFNLGNLGMQGALTNV
eukprot:g22423.t1